MAERKAITRRVPKKIVLLDYYSEKNRGDAAIQVGLIRLVRKRFPEAEISVVAAIGANQARDIPEHFPHTLREGVEVMGGVCPTIVAAREPHFLLRMKLARVAFVAFSITVCVLLLAMLALRLPPSFVALFLPRTFREALQDLAAADLILWRGTNFRMGKRVLREAYSTFMWCYQPLVCMLLGRPVACVGVSLWSPKTVFSRSILCFVFRRCVFLAAREEESVGRVRELLGEKGPGVTLLPDLSFVLLQSDARSIQRAPSTNTIGVTLVGRNKEDAEGVARYVRLMRSFVDTILSDSRRSIVVIPQATTRSEDASSIVDDIVSGIAADKRERIRIRTEELSIEELLKTYAGLDALVATRLHSSIFALAVGTPVFVLQYDEGPQWNILSMLGVKDFVMEYRKLDERGILECFGRFMERTEYPMSDVQKNFERYYQEIKTVFAGVPYAYDQWVQSRKK